MRRGFLAVALLALVACGGDVAAPDPDPDTPTPTPAQPSAWQWQNPTPSANHAVGIEALGDGRALLLTEFDAFLTEDSGESWRTVDELGRGFFVDLYRHGNVTTVLSGGQVYVSTDNGDSWRSRRFGPIAREAAAFVDANHGIVVGSQGVIVTTDDGGDTWTQRFSGTEFGLADVAYLDANTVFAVGVDVFRSLNGGATWETLEDTGVFSFGNAIDITSGIVRIVDRAADVSISADGGETWIEENLGINGQLYGIAFLDAARGLTAGDFGRLMVTSNGGSSWTERELGTMTRMSAVSASAVDDWWVAGNDGEVFRSTNGFTWETVRGGHAIDLVEVSFFDENVGMAVGPECGLIVTTNGGETWGRGKLPSPLVVNCNAGDLNAVSMFGPKSACAVGPRGELWTTSNRGIPWTRRDSGTLDDLHAVAFADSVHGIAVGTAGVVRVTNDGGVNWTEHDTGVSEANRAIAMSSRDVAMLAGQFGNVRRSTDGGVSWTSVRADLPRIDFSDIAMLDDTTAVVIGSNEVGEPNIFSTSDGGATWEGNRLSSDPYAIDFDAEGRGYIVADRRIFISGDAGVTWSPKNTNTRSILRAVCAIGNGVATIVGDDGAVLRTTSGGE